MAPQVASLAFRQERGIPWHGLGTPATGKQTAKELAVLAKMDYTMKLMPNVAVHPDSPADENGIYGVQSYIPTGSGTIYSNRTGEWSQVSTVKRIGNYQIPQNMEVAEIIDTPFNGNAALSDIFDMDVAGVLSDGKFTFFSLAMGEDVVKLGIEGDDHYETHTLFFNDFVNGKLSAAISVIRTVCINTAQLALRDSSKRGTLWTFSHRRDSLTLLQYYAELVMHLQAERVAFYDSLQQMVGINWTNSDQENFVNAVYPLPPVPSHVTRAEIGRNYNISVSETVEAIASDAQKKWELDTARIKGYREGLNERIAVYADEFHGLTKYAGFQAATDFIGWREPERGNWNDVAESLLTDTRKLEMDRLMKAVGLN
jgi:hypothetical protein